MRKTLAVIFSTNSTEADKANEVDVDSEVDIDSEMEKDEDIMNARDYMGLDLHQHNQCEQNLEQSSSSTKNRSEIKDSLKDLLDKAY